jgi:hypothetical protein
VLEDGSPIKLRLNRNLSSADAHTGDTVDFDVIEDVTLNGTLVIPKGGLAFATVTEAQSKRRMARGGKLNVNIDYVKLLDSEKAPLRAVKEVKGGGTHRRHDRRNCGGWDCVLPCCSLLFVHAWERHHYS